MKSSKQKLLTLYRALSVADQQTLLAFAEFLAGREQASALPRALPEPTLVPRPEKESVVGALKRLSASYPMLDKSKMLDQTSALVAQHVMQGRQTAEVIDELELVFLRHFEAIKRQLEEKV